VGQEGGGDGKGEAGRERGREGEETRPHPFTPHLIHISGYAPELSPILGI